MNITTHFHRAVLLYIYSFSSFADVIVPESTEFKSLEEFVSEKTLNAIADMGFTNMMEIQHKSIVPLLKGRYVVTIQILTNP